MSRARILHLLPHHVLHLCPYSLALLDFLLHAQNKTLPSPPPPFSLHMGSGSAPRVCLSTQQYRSRRAQYSDLLAGAKRKEIAACGRLTMGISYRHNYVAKETQTMSLSPLPCLYRMATLSCMYVLYGALCMYIYDFAAFCSVQYLNVIPS